MMHAFFMTLGGAPRAQLAAAYNATHTRAAPANAFAEFTLESDGDIITTQGATPTDQGDWVTPKTAAGGNYECRLTVNTGTNPSGSAVGTWLALSSTRSWSHSATSDGGELNLCSCTLQIRSTATGTVLATSTITISAETTP